MAGGMLSEYQETDKGRILWRGSAGWLIPPERDLWVRQQQEATRECISEGRPCTLIHIAWEPQFMRHYPLGSAL